MTFRMGLRDQKIKLKTAIHDIADKAAKIREFSIQPHHKSDDREAARDLCNTLLEINRTLSRLYDSLEDTSH